MIVATHKAAWMARAAEMMVRRGLSIHQAASELDVKLVSDELKKAEKSQTFQELLWTERHRFYNEIASNPGRTKTSMLGLLTLAIQNLALQAEWDKVAECIFKLARIEGWTNSDDSKVVIANVTQADIDAARLELEKLVGHPKESRESLSN